MASIFVFSKANKKEEDDQREMEQVIVFKYHNELYERVILNLLPILMMLSIGRCFSFFCSNKAKLHLEMYLLSKQINIYWKQKNCI